MDVRFSLVRFALSFLSRFSGVRTANTVAVNMMCDEYARATKDFIGCTERCATTAFMMKMTADAGSVSRRRMAEYGVLEHLVWAEGVVQMLERKRGDLTEQRETATGNIPEASARACDHEFVRRALQSVRLRRRALSVSARLPILAKMRVRFACDAHTHALMAEIESEMSRMSADYGLTT